ncbi:MAG TPA: nuclear transport factor 2 family protein, partial [Gaiellales bacterium]|nr:nuclear transport factor 2 family protein [Gaiellales bacterium]
MGVNVADADRTVAAGDDPGEAGPLIRAFVEGDRGRLEATLHPDVEVHLSAFVDPDLWLRGREAVLRWYGRTAGSHRAYLHRVAEAAPAVWLAFGRMQLSEPHRGMRDYQVVWVIALRNGAVWRA